LRIGAIFCNCSGQITEKIDFNKLRKLINKKVSWIKEFDLACSDKNLKKLINFLKKRKTEALIIIGCTPKNKEHVFRNIAKKAGINPYMLRIVNAREQVAWVTDSREEALKKVYTLFISVVNRLKQQKPLFEKKFPVCKNILIVGAGIAGIKAAITLSKAGRKVYLVEKESFLGGKAGKYEKLFPDLACGSCIMQQIVDEIFTTKIELRLNTELKELKGFFGNIHAKIKSKPLYVNIKKCIGCAACESVCPVQAIKVDPMKLPAVARINFDKCLRFKGQLCDYCIKECPLPGTINFDEKEKEEALKVGAVLWATGFKTMDCSQIPELGYGRFKDVYNSLEFEEILNSQGSTRGEILTEEGKVPQSIAIIHCVGSLDEKYYPYCSKICCQYAFKFNRVIRQSLPDTEIIHFIKEITLPDKDASRLYFQAVKDPFTRIIRYQSLKELRVEKQNSLVILFKQKKFPCDIVILCPAIISLKESPPAEISGVFLTGSVKEPMTIKESITDAVAQVGHILSTLTGYIKKEPFIAKIDYDRCVSCGICVNQCPYKAIEIEINKPKILEIICEGCGVCVAACPSKAITLDGYSDEEILSEIGGILDEIKS